MRLSPRQQEIARYGGRGHRWTLVSGPRGSGKTHAGLIGFLLWQHHLADADLGMVCRAPGHLKDALHGGLQRILGRELPYREGSIHLPGAGGSTNRVRMLTAGDSAGLERLRGHSWSGALVDEMTLLHDDVLVEVNTICRVGDPRIIGLTNPDGPDHHVKTQWFDRAGEDGNYAVFMEMADNPSYSPATMASIASRYTGHMYDRMVLGLWVAAEGLLYPTYREHIAEAPADGLHPSCYVGVDVGKSRITHAVLAQRHDDGTTWIVDELRHDNRESSDKSITALVTRLRRRWAGRRIWSWIVDPAERDFIDELARQVRGESRVIRADNDHEEGIQEVNRWFRSGALKIDPSCRELIHELGNRSWADEAAKRGEDRPEHSSDHGLDAMRYLVYTMQLDAAGRARHEAIVTRRVR